MLIGVIALIFLGPRKLPQMARTVGKMMAEFRRTTSEFKSTWEREANFEVDDTPSTGEPPYSIARLGSTPGVTQSASLPEIKEMDSSEFDKIVAERASTTDQPPAGDTAAETDASDKRSWL